MKPIKYLLLLALIGSLLASCSTEKYDDFNTDPYALKPDYLKADWLYIGGYITQMEKSIYFNADNRDWDFQIGQNLSADIYSGYLTPPTPFNEDRNNANYDLRAGWNLWTFKYHNIGIMGPWLKIKEESKDKNEFLEIYAVANILKVTGMLRSTDTYGPIPYSEFGKGGVSVAYDSQESVYMQFFKELDEAQKILTDFLKSERKDVKALAKHDMIYKSNYEQWMRYANSLRLRLAIRISKVAPAKAKAEAEKAISNSYGLVIQNEDNFIIRTSSMKNPLNILAYSYNDTRMSADMESILCGLKDPRVAKYFSPAKAEDPNIKGHYRGIRQGINTVDKGLREGYSNLAPAWAVENQYNNDICLLNAAEVNFLLAEGSLRGWNTGNTAKHFYEDGVRSSFAYWQCSGVADYLADDSSVPRDYVDYALLNKAGQHDSRYDAPAASQVHVRYNASASKEQQLEQIITQKWIACFPDGVEAWAEFRRTGYPKQFPMVENYSGGTIDSQIKIRRLPFSEDEYKNNKDEVLKAVQMLKGPDNGGTQLWWDTNAGASNF